ncbi:MAG: hypothetical protein AAF206_21110 [Bacteroidota bacterium]
MLTFYTNRQVIFSIGLLGLSLFTLSWIVGGFLVEDYSLLSQYISESYQ